MKSLCSYASSPLEHNACRAAFAWVFVLAAHLKDDLPVEHVILADGILCAYMSAMLAFTACTETAALFAGFWRNTWKIVRGMLDAVYTNLPTSMKDPDAAQSSTKVALLAITTLIAAGDEFLQVCQDGTLTKKRRCGLRCAVLGPRSGLAACYLAP